VVLRVLQGIDKVRHRFQNQVLGPVLEGQGRHGGLPLRVAVAWWGGGVFCVDREG
jgi:hypothetical protein